MFKGNEGYQSVQTSLAPGDLVQSAVVVSSTPGGTVFLEPQAVTLTELPGGTVQTLPGGSTFEGNLTFNITKGLIFKVLSKMFYTCSYSTCIIQMYHKNQFTGKLTVTQKSADLTQTSSFKMRKQ